MNAVFYLPSLEGQLKRAMLKSGRVAQVSCAVLSVLASPNRGWPMSRDFRDMGTTTVSTMGFTPLAFVSSTSERSSH